MLLRSIALAALVAPVALAQRAPIRGAVELADGSPWAGATVTLLHRPVPTDERFGAEDRVVATTDAGGRFAATLVPGRLYSVWAVQGLDDGDHLGSAVVEGYSFGQPLTLRAVSGPRPPARVKVAGLRLWRSWGEGNNTIQVRAITGCRNVDLHTLELDERDVAELPPLPGYGASVEILWNGAPLLAWPRPVTLGTEEPKMVRVNAPRATRFDVVDETGAKLAGIDLLLGAIDTGTYERDNYTRLATSDDEGKLVVPLPIGRGRKFAWHNYPAAFQGEGRAPLHWISTLEVPADHDGSKDPAVGVVELRASTPWRCTLHSRGTPLAALPLRVRTLCDFAMPAYDGYHGVYQFAEADARGQCHIDLTPEREFALVAYPSTEVLEDYAAPGWPVHAAVLLAADHATAAREGVLDVADLAALDVQVLDAGGAPASGARLAIGRDDPDARFAGVLRDISCNHAGRVRILVPRSDSLRLAAWSGAAWAVTTVDTREPRESPEQISLQAVPELPGVLLRKDGVPATSERLRLSYSAVEGRSTLAWGMSPIFVGTQDRGRFALPLFPGMEVSFARQASSGGFHGVQGELRTDDPPAELELQLGR